MKQNNGALPKAVKQIQKLEENLPRTLGSDRHRLRKRILYVKKRWKSPKLSKPTEAQLNRLEQDIHRSISKRIQRLKNLPKISVNARLPIAEKSEAIISAIQNHQVIIISGETGSGKTTQIPKLCLAAGRGIDGLIGCTQPRRLAATSVASRIAEELGQELGRSVGYKIRFDERFSTDCYIKIMTDGILLAEAQNDPFLNNYDTIIVDEAHERSLNIDFILGILKKRLKQRPDLKLIVTSATLDTEKFSKAFDHAPIIEVSGRLFPVEVRYISPEDLTDEDLTPVESAVNTLEMLLKDSAKGDVLIFMPTEQDIREACEILEGKSFKGVWIIPLFARLSAQEQKKVFRRYKGRKIIVCTNIAETSITIPGIKYVIDTGLARISRYIPRTRTTTLPVELISRSSADQRMGRSGRVENGICIRLFSKEDYENRQKFTPPEILRSNLADVILRMIALDLGDVETFPFIDPPDFKSIKDGFDLLKELHAIEASRTKKGKQSFRLTTKGKLMARLPLDPRISRMLIEGIKEGCLLELIVIGSALSIQDPRERPIDEEKNADLAHKAFHHPNSDFLTLLNIWAAYTNYRKNNSTTGMLKRFCKTHFLSFRRMREWGDINHQIYAVLQEIGWCDTGRHELDCIPPVIQSDVKKYSDIHKSVLSGYLSNIAQKKEKNIYQAAKGKTVMIFPGSCMFNSAGRWIVSAEMVETSRLFARTCAGIQNEWIEPLGGSLCSRIYENPHWDKERSEVVAIEQVTLFGLLIVPRRRISFGKIDPEKASDIFVREAISEHHISEPFAFMAHNQRMIDEVLDMENRLRRRDILVSSEEIFRFYRKRIDKDVYDLKSLRALIKKKGGDNFLRMSRENLISCLPDLSELAMYPDEVHLGADQFFCEYKFNPGEEDDGVTVKIPVEKTSSIRGLEFDWHIPGLLPEKIFALIKGLPKPYRKQLVPVSETVKIISQEMPKSRESLLTALTRFVHNRFGAVIPLKAWPQENLPEHLQIRYAVTDASGKALQSGRNRKILESHPSQYEGSSELHLLKTSWEKENLQQWILDEIPEQITLQKRNGKKVLFYPALHQAKDNQVHLRLYQNPRTAQENHPKGVCALYERLFSKELKFLRKNLRVQKQFEKATTFFGGMKTVEKRIYNIVVEKLFSKNIRTRDKFESYGLKKVSELQRIGLETLSRSLEVIQSVYGLHMTLSKRESSSAKAYALILPLKIEVSKLVSENFMTLYGHERMPDLVRYIKALEVRAERMLLNPEKDFVKSQKIKTFSDKLNELLSMLTPEVSPEKKRAVEDLFWMLEEFKVSIFAQELKTAQPVSEKRIQNKIYEINQMI